jgi:outer membrane PBP1 activator LpoA protein
MAMARFTITLLCAAMVLAACTPDSGQTPKLADEQREALDRAQAVESQMQQAAEAKRRNIDEQSQ